MSDLKNFKEKYKTIRTFNSGGQGSTILAQEIECNVVDGIIIKVLNKQNDDERRARMHREFVIMETLKSDLIPKVLCSNTEYYSDSDYNLFIAMEYIEGITLSELIEKNYNNISLEDKIVFIKKILNTLKYFHESGVIHRDIKPDNIILKNNDIKRPILIDFGLSFNNDNNVNITPDEQILGNRFLALPELGMNSNNKNDIRSDITMVIGLLFFLITKKQPGHLTDEKGKLPHQRTIELDNKQQEDLKLFSYIFDIGFQQNINFRFQNIQNLLSELDIIGQSEKKYEDILNELKSFNERRITRSVNEQLENERLLNFATNIIDETFFLVVANMQNSVELIRIKRSSTGWCAYTIRDKIKNANSISLKIEVQFSGDFLFFSGGEVELHGIYTKSISRIVSVNKNGNIKEQQKVLLKFLLEKILDKYEL